MCQGAGTGLDPVAGCGNPTPLMILGQPDGSPCCGLCGPVMLCFTFVSLGCQNGRIFLQQSRQ